MPRWSIVLLVLVAAFALDRLMVAGERRGWVYWRRRGQSGALTGAMFAEIHQLTTPAYRYVVQQRDHDRIVADQAGDSDRPQGGAGS